MSRGRFIAGAVCPQCGAMDRLLIEFAGPDRPESEDANQRRCVACGYSDARPAASSVEPRTRIEGGLKNSRDDVLIPVDRVRIVDPDAA